VRLTFTGDAWENEPAGSSDGRWIAYVRQGTMGPPKIWVMSRDGRNTHQVTFGAGNDASPTWSADSTRLAFASDRDGDWDIYALDLLTGAVGQLTDDPAEDMAPDWSWITGRIAFQSNRVGPNSEIFTMAADGSDVRRVTMNPNGDSQPSWSPLADRIAFWGTRDQQALYTVRADGSDVRLFVPQVLRPGSPAWAAVGETVAFSGFRQDSGYSEVMRVQADGSDLVLLTFNEVNFDYAPGWLPGR
jgi:Tol biopolymer transport system component